MKDVLQVADSRKSNLQSEIEKREAEIAGMREEIQSLDEFMAYGKGLIERGEDATVAERPKSQPSPKLAESLNALRASNEDDDDQDDDEFPDEDEADDEFDTMADDEQLSKSIAQLRTRSRPISRPA